MVPFYKIRADLHETWLWQDAEPLYWKWWCDLQYMASYTTRRIRIGSEIREIRPGQLVASISYLVNRWGKSKNMIIRFLHLLEEDGLICKESSHNVSIITILFHAGFGDNHEDNHEDNPRDNHENNLVQSDNSDKYRKCGEQINNPRDNHKNNPRDNHKNNPRDNHEDNPRDNQRDTNIKRKKDKNKEMHSTSAETRTREGDLDVFETFEGVDEEVKALQADQKWKEQVFGRFKFLGGCEQSFSKYLQMWAGEVKMRGRGHDNLNDAKEHFKNWLLVQEDKAKSKKQEKSPAPLTRWKQMIEKIGQSQSQDDVEQFSQLFFDSFSENEKELVISAPSEDFARNMGANIQLLCLKVTEYFGKDIKIKFKYRNEK